MKNADKIVLHDEKTTYEEFIEPALSFYEKAVYSSIVIGLFIFFIIAFWSGVVFYFDVAADKAPLALLMRFIPIHLLL